MEIVQACFMQMTNLGYVVAYLKYVKPINNITRLITNSLAYAHAVNYRSIFCDQFSVHINTNNPRNY